MSKTQDNKEKVLKLKKPIEKVIVKRLATEAHPTIQAVLSGLFRFVNKEDAIERLDAIKTNFITSSRLPKSIEKNATKLWIRGFQIEKGEEEQGYLGNYALIKITQIDGKYTLVSEKQRVNLNYHPHKKRPKERHPDWGHPALRIIKRGAVFETLEEANKIFSQLHEEYPKATIPNPNKLYVMIYSRTPEDKRSENDKTVTKYLLEIKPSREGGYFIEYKQTKVEEKNNKKNERYKTYKVPQEKEAKAPEATQENRQKGYFTSMVELKKAKSKAKQKRPTPKLHKEEKK